MKPASTWFRRVCDVCKREVAAVELCVCAIAVQRLDAVNLWYCSVGGGGTRLGLIWSSVVLKPFVFDCFQ